MVVSDPGRDPEREHRFVQLYERQYGAVLAYTRRRVPETTARDVAAETFLVAWRKLDDAIDGGLPWLYKTAALTLRNWHRTQRRSDRLSGRLAAEPSPPAGPDPALVHADREPVIEALRSLAETDRELLLLVVWEDLDVRTAAKIVGCSAGAAAVRLHRARRKLRGLLTDPALTIHNLTSEVPR